MTTPRKHKNQDTLLQKTLRIYKMMFQALNIILLTLIFMITSAQMKAARALLGIDQQQLADLSGLSQPTIQRMEASDGTIRGNVDSLVKVIDALNRAGVELIGEAELSASGGRGVRLKTPPPSE